MAALWAAHLNRPVCPLWVLADKPSRAKIHLCLLWSDTVAKVGGPLQVSNYRIKRARRLNQSCATHRFLEPILRVGMRKFFLQQYLPIADSCTATNRISI